MSSQPSDMRTLDNLVFHHMPKTAGTFLYAFLTQLFRDDQVCPGFNETTIDGFRSEGVDYRFFSGHFNYEFLVSRFPGYEWITFVREPVARVVSHYRNWSNPARIQERWRDTNQQFSASEIDETLAWVATASLKEFVSSERLMTMHACRNRMVRSLCGGELDRNLMGAGAYDQDVVDQAVANLFSRFRFFGLTERMQESLHLFCDTYGLFPRDTREMARHNVSKEAVRISDNDVDLIRQCNLMDIALYERARKEFERRYLELVGNLMVTKYFVPRSNEGNTCEGVSVSTVIDVDMSKPLAHGLHYLERDAQSKPYRWTGAMPQIRLHFPRPATAARAATLRLSAINVAGPQIWEQLEVACNGVPASRLIKRESMGCWECEAIFPSLPPCDEAFDVVTLATPLVKVGEGAGAREVGIAIQTLALAYG